MISSSRPIGARIWASAASNACTLALGGSQVGALLIDGLQRHRAGFEIEERLGSLQIALAPCRAPPARPPDWPAPVDLGRLAAVAEIGELLLRLCQLSLGLIDRGPVGGVVLIEQRRAGRDLVAARDRHGGEQTLLGRADLDEIGLRIALPLDRKGSARPHPPPAGARQPQHRDHQDENVSAHLTCHRDLTFCNETVSLHYR